MGIYSLAFGPLKNGSIGFMPSDTIYGLSCLALDPVAVERIHALKDRGLGKPFIVLLSETGQAEQLGINLEELKLAEQYWPGPLTMIVPAGSRTPNYLHRGLGTIAVRVPGRADLRELISKTGPIISTSANPQGQPTAETVEDAKLYFGGSLDFYVDDGPLNGKPSTIAVVKDGQLQTIRQGALKINS